MTEQARDIAMGHTVAPGTAGRTHPRGPAAPIFGSILFPPGLEGVRAERGDEPTCFVNLNLDQVIDAVVAKRDEEILRPIFYSPYRNVDVVRYRQAVFCDLERPEVFGIFPVFSAAMRMVRANLGYAKKISHRCHRHTVILRAAGLYCDAVARLLRDLQSLVLHSAGLRDLQRYLADYVSSQTFTQLAEDTIDLQQSLSQISYGMLFRGDQVTVRKYASEPDYVVTILARFAKFRETAAEAPAPPKPTDDFSLNHIEQGILEFVGRLFPAQFHCLADYVGRHAGFIDEVVARFDREIGFFIAYLDFIDPLKRAGLPFCIPDVSVSSKDIRVAGGFDLALAAKLVREDGAMVCNDYRLSGHERMIVVSGPNQGGKTTFARMFGQLPFLAGLGCLVPGLTRACFSPINSSPISNVKRTSPICAASSRMTWCACTKPARPSRATA
jgi:DNA mismatch repair protein MutS